MNRKNLFALAAIGCLSTVCNAGSAYVWTSGSLIDPNKWADADNWSGGPTWPGDVANDTARIPTGLASNLYPLLDGNYSIDGIEVENGASVRLASHTLTIADADAVDLEPGSLVRVNGAGNFAIVAGGNLEIGSGAEVRLEVSGSTMTFSNSTTLVGHSSDYGIIVGFDTDAQIVIAAGATLTNGVAIEGSLKVMGDSGSQFVNKVLANDFDSGRVSALDGGVLEFEVDVLVSDDRATMARDPLFQAIGARLVIHNTINNDGDYNFDSQFAVDDCGALWVGINEYIYTTLQMPAFSGTIRTDLGGSPNLADFFDDDNGTYVDDDFTTLECDKQ